MNLVVDTKYCLIIAMAEVIHLLWRILQAEEEGKPPLEVAGRVIHLCK